MGEKVKEIPNKLLEFWNKYDAKQKTIIISVAAALLLTFAILISFLAKPVYVDLVTCESAKQSAEVKNLLEDEGIKYEVSDDALRFRVKKGDLSNATMVLGSNSIPTDAYTIDMALGGGFSTTEADKEKKYKLYSEEDIENIVESMPAVERAAVKFVVPNNDGTIISQNKETTVSVMLGLKYDLTSEAANTLALFLKTAVGNKTTENITIIDENGKTLFSGSDVSSAVGIANSNLSVKAEAEARLKEEVKKAILSTSVYDNVEVTPNLVLNFDVVKKTRHEYSAPDGRTEGMLAEQELYESEANNAAAGTPGTDANDDAEYVIQDGGDSSSNTSNSVSKYLPNEEITDTESAPGSVVYDESSFSVVLTSHTIFKEEDLEEQGLLNGTTYEQYKNDNGQPVAIEVDPSFIALASKATGIPEANISIVAYNVPQFLDRDSSQKSVMDYIQIVLVILILALLGFVVFKSTRPVEVTETEPELSVEELLSATRENLEDIDFDDKSETRKMIEKFVDENPDAVAQLLRNWLNEDWE